MLHGAGHEKDWIPGTLGIIEVVWSAGGNPQFKMSRERDAVVGINSGCMLKRSASHVIVGEWWKVQVALGIYARASTFSRILGLF